MEWTTEILFTYLPQMEYFHGAIRMSPLHAKRPFKRHTGPRPHLYINDDVGGNDNPRTPTDKCEGGTGTGI